MITVLAKNKAKHGVIELPAYDGKVQSFCADLGVKHTGLMKIQYAGTGKHRSIDIPLLENTLKNKQSDIEEINLLAYLVKRMDDNQIKNYSMRLSENSDDLRTRSIKDIINDAYETFGPESEQYYDGENLNELIVAERKKIAPYQTMNKDIFWEMIDTARQQSKGDYNTMQRILTEQLTRMEPEHIALFDAIKEAYLKAAESVSVYKLGCELNDRGLSDDGFMDFRGWLIGQGKEVYIQAMKEPESVSKLDLKPRGNRFEWETFNYIGYEAYELRTGHEMYTSAVTAEQMKQIETDVLSVFESNTAIQEKHISELDQLMGDL